MIERSPILLSGMSTCSGHFNLRNSAVISLLTVIVYFVVFFDRYNESGKESDLEKCQEQMERLERKAKKYDDERESLAENINAINKDIATQKVYTHT